VSCGRRKRKRRRGKREEANIATEEIVDAVSGKVGEAWLAGTVHIGTGLHALGGPPMERLAVP